MAALISPSASAEASPGESISLGELLSELGPATATLLGPSDIERTVRGTDFYDSFEELREDPDTLLLAASMSGMPSDRITALAEQSARLGYSGIALKCHESEVTTYTAIAEASGIPFIRVSERLGWRLFDALIAQFLGERRHSEDAHRDRGAEPLFALANELAGFFGGSVAIEDLGRRIIAYSSVPGQLIDTLRTQGILTRHVPDSPFNDDQYRTVLRSDDPIKYPKLDEEEPRVACAIRAGALPLGTIWAIDASGEGKLTDEQALRITTAAGIAASHMLDDIRVRKATQIPREDRLRTLLDGGDIMGSELAELGVSEERGATLLAFAPPHNDHPTVPAQLRSTVQRHLTLHRPEAVTVVRGGRVYALMANDSASSTVALIEPLLPILDRLIGPGVQVASPGVAHRSGEVAPLRELADLLFDTVARQTETISTRILTVESMRSLLVLERAASMFAGSPELRAREVERMESDDPLVAETVRAWCANFGNIARTARALCIHENTARYRLRRAEEKYGLDLEDADTLLITWLQLRAPVRRQLSTSHMPDPTPTAAAAIAVAQDRSTP
mgnify:FL=1